MHSGNLNGGGFVAQCGLTQYMRYGIGLSIAAPDTRELLGRWRW